MQSSCAFEVIAPSSILQDGRSHRSSAIAYQQRILQARQERRLHFCNQILQSNLYSFKKRQTLF
jgi:hypothetical protein